MKNKTILLNGLLALLTGAAMAQQALQSSTQQIQNVDHNYVVKHLTEADGLLRNGPYIYKDSRGVVWFFLHGGIQSFDGSRCTDFTFNTNDPFRSPLTSANTVLEDGSGQIWFFEASNIAIYDPSTEKFQKIQDRFPANTVLPSGIGGFATALKDPLHRLWINALNGLFVFDHRTGKLERKSDSLIRRLNGQSTNIVSWTVDSDNHIWGLSDRGLFRYDSNTDSLMTSFTGILSAFDKGSFEYYNSISYDSLNQSLWIIGEDNKTLFRISLRNNQMIRYTFSIESGYPERVFVNINNTNKGTLNLLESKTSRRGDVWLTTNQGILVKLKVSLNQFEYIESNFDAPTAYWASASTSPELERPRFGLVDDNSDEIFINANNAVNIISERRAPIAHLSFERSDRHRLYRFRRFMALKENRFLGLNVGPSGNFEFIFFDSTLHILRTLYAGSAAVLSEYEDLADSLVFFQASEDGRNDISWKRMVCDLNAMTMHEWPVPVSEPKVPIWTQLDSYGVCWWGGVTIYNCDFQAGLNDTFKLQLPFERDNEPKTGAFHRPSQTYWLSYYNQKYVYRVNLTNGKVDKVFRNQTGADTTLWSDPTYFLREIDKDLMAAVSLNDFDIIHVHSNKIEHLSEVLNTQAYFSDAFRLHNGKLWVNTSKEIVELDLQTHHYRKVVFEKDYLFWASTHQVDIPVAENGDFIIINDDGIMRFHPDSIFQERHAGDIRFSSVLLDGQFLSLDSVFCMDEITLAYNKYQNLALHFSDYSVYDQDRISYHYAMYTGGDTVWNSLEKPELILRDLAPDNYKLFLRAKHELGGYSDNITVVGIHVIPPFWQRWWFFALIAIAALSLFYALYLYRVTQLKNLLAVRTKISQDLHDEIGSTLSGIAMYGHLTKAQLKSGQINDVEKSVDIIQNSASEMVSKLNEIVWTVNPRNDSFIKLFQKLEEYATEIAFIKGIKVSMEVPPSIAQVKLPMTSRHNIYLICKEAINNAVKYSNATTLNLLVRDFDHTLEFIVQDNGVGFDIQNVRKGNGLDNMQKRAGEIGAKVTFSSSPGNGTTLLLHVNVSARYAGG